MDKSNENEERKDRAALLLERKKIMNNLVLLFAASFVVLIGALTMAWFAFNKAVNGENISITVKGPDFMIKPLGSPAFAGIYDDANNQAYVRDKLLSETDLETGVITWTITGDTVTTNNDGSKTYNRGLNLGNGPAEGYEGGINPGSQGTIQFIVKPNVDAVNVNFDFHFFAYVGGYDEHGDEDKTTISIIGTGADDDLALAEKLFNGHVLLFSNEDANGKYDGLIASNDQFYRLLNGSYSSEATVSIHWVWPETLAELVFDESNTEQAKKLKGKKSICNSTGQAEVLSFLKAHPNWFLYDPENEDFDWSTLINENMTDSEVLNTINSGYQRYSSYYNEADQYIGTLISYVLLNMSASLDTSSSP